MLSPKTRLLKPTLFKCKTQITRFSATSSRRGWLSGRRVCLSARPPAALTCQPRSRVSHRPCSRSEPPHLSGAPRRSIQRSLCGTTSSRQPHPRSFLFIKQTPLRTLRKETRAWACASRSEGRVTPPLCHAHTPATGRATRERNSKATFTRYFNDKKRVNSLSENVNKCEFRNYCILWVGEEEVYFRFESFLLFLKIPPNNLNSMNPSIF